MEGTPEQHQHVHAEVVDVEEPRLGKEKDKDTEELGDSDSTEDRGTHVIQSRLCPLPASANVRDKPADNVGAKLDGNTNSL